MGSSAAKQHTRRIEVERTRRALGGGGLCIFHQSERAAACWYLVAEGNNLSTAVPATRSTSLDQLSLAVPPVASISTFYKSQVVPSTDEHDVTHNCISQIHDSRTQGITRCYFLHSPVTRSS
jgi:hypothetical protein